MARTFFYIPRPRRLGWLLDLAVVAATIACIMHFSRHYVVDCRWDKVRASCDVSYEDALGRQTRETVAGIRGSAYRSQAVVGLVTDARHKGENALFGTREVLLDTTDAAQRLEAFASDGEPEHLSIESGAPKPLLLTVGLLAALLVYMLATRSRAVRVEVDDCTRSVTVRGGQPARYAIEAIRSVWVEDAREGQRVVLRLQSGEARPLTDDFSKGAHHGALATQLASALGVSVG
ncbi:MAG TPA: hypothetical protein VLM85_31080 [Polyangiaceae bacterium]|nr:hypothetical protein [Polyangiaceae bacterium]